MPSIVGIGRYVVKGIHGTVEYTGLLSTSNKVSDLSYSKQFGVSEHRDGQSSVFSVTADEPVEEISVTFTPIAPILTATIAGAKAALVVPDPLGVVTVASTPGGITAGAYSYISGSIRMSTDNTAVIDMVIRKYAGFTSDAPTSFIS